MKQKTLLSFSIFLGLSCGLATASTFGGSEKEIIEGNQSYKPSGEVYSSGQLSNGGSFIQKVDDTEDRVMYGIVAHNPLLDYNWGLARFNSKSPGEIELMHPWSDNLSIFAGAAAFDEYYAFFYIFDAVMGPKPESLSKINLRTGEIRKVQDWGSLTFKLQDMTFDYKNNTMWGIGFSLGSSYLYSIDIETGDINQERPLQKVLVTLASDYSGNLYGVDTRGDLYEVDKATGLLELVCQTGIQPDMNQTMEFDHTDGSLYWASNEYSGDNKLIKFDISNKTFKSVGNLGGNGTQVMGLYIPYALGGFSTPGQSSDVSFKAGLNGSEEATISWTNPTITHGGQPLSVLSTVTIERNGEKVHSVEEVTPGEEIVWEDKDVKTGEHVYTIIAANEHGDGRPVNIDGYVGRDIPARVQNINIQSGENCKSIDISWDATIEGGHAGYFPTEGITYDVTRYPDEIVVAENLTETTFKDESIKRLAQYYYGVTAKNEVGSGNQGYAADIIVAGDPIDIPYSCEFINEIVDKNQWSCIDGNKDGLGWYYNAGYSNIYFGGYSFGLEYVQFGQDSQEDADEWLISPPTNFEEGKDYSITFESRSMGEDLINITMGTSNSVASQVHQVESEIKIDSYMLKQYTVDIPREMITPGINCFGFNLVTPFGKSNLCQLTNIYIQEVESTSVEEDEYQSEVAVIYSSGMLEIRGEFESAEVFALSGNKIMQFSSDTKTINTSDWEKGIYIARVISSGDVCTVKFVIK